MLEENAIPYWSCRNHISHPSSVPCISLPTNERVSLYLLTRFVYQCLERCTPWQFLVLWFNTPNNKIRHWSVFRAGYIHLPPLHLIRHDPNVPPPPSSSSYSNFCIKPSGPFPIRINLELQRVGRTPWTVDQPVARPLPTQDNTYTEETLTDIHASSGIRTHDPSVRASEDISCLRRRGHCDRQCLLSEENIVCISLTF
jgi:hypothetical protein